MDSAKRPCLDQEAIRRQDHLTTDGGGGHIIRGAAVDNRCHPVAEGCPADQALRVQEIVAFDQRLAGEAVQRPQHLVSVLQEPVPQAEALRPAVMSAREHSRVISSLGG